MSSNTLIDKIRAEAEAEVAKIKVSAEADVAEIERETAAAVAVLKTEAASLLEKKRAQQELVATSKAKQDGKLRTQTAKRDALDALFASVYEDMTALPTAEYVAFFTTQAKQIVPTTVVVTAVFAPENRVAETKEILSALGLSGEVLVAPEIAAGFIVTTADGVYDVTFKRIFELARPELEMQVVTEFLNS